MTIQETILRACNHLPADCEVNMGKREILHVCSECWNRSVTARLSERKQQLAAHWTQYATEQQAAMKAAGAEVGQRVSYFCASLLGFGGFVVTGTITLNRNRIAVIRLDQKYQGRRFVEWSKGWRALAPHAQNQNSILKF